MSAWRWVVYAPDRSGGPSYYAGPYLDNRWGRWVQGLSKAYLFTDEADAAAFWLQLVDRPNRTVRTVVRRVLVGRPTQAWLCWDRPTRMTVNVAAVVGDMSNAVYMTTKIGVQDYDSDEPAWTTRLARARLHSTAEDAAAESLAYAAGSEVGFLPRVEGLLLW